jgi:hypothetical protein
MQQKHDLEISRVPTWIWRGLVFILWLITVGFGIFTIFLSSEIALGIYVRFSTAAGPAALMHNIVVLVMSLIWIAYTFGTGEYHWKKAGSHTSWTLLAWAIAIELLIMILYFVI